MRDIRMFGGELGLASWSWRWGRVDGYANVARGAGKAFRRPWRDIRMSHEPPTKPPTHLSVEHGKMDP